jgi:hypothetical protein
MEKLFGRMKLEVRLYTILLWLVEKCLLGLTMEMYIVLEAPPDLPPAGGEEKGKTFSASQYKSPQKGEISKSFIMKF